MKVSVIGTGYVGLVSGTCFSEIGHEVTCVDIDQEKINKLTMGEIPIYEPGLSDLVKKNVKSGKLYFTTDIKYAVTSAEIIIIAVGTPPLPSGEADLSYIFSAAKSIGENLNEYKVIVTKSTVPLGTNLKIKEIVNEASGGKYDFDIASNPEFLREGSAVYDTLNMERAVIGTETEKAALILEELHKGFNTTIIKTDVSTAELIKYAANSFLATKISFINEMAKLAEKFGADINKIAEGMGTDSRIGPHFLKAGIGYGGSCFPKDISALLATGIKNGIDLPILEAVTKVNVQQRNIIINKINEAFNGELINKRIAILGLAFKPNTDDMRESPAITVINELKKANADIIAYDPIAIPNACKIIPDLNASTNIDDVLNGADGVVIITDWKEIKEIDLDKMKTLLKNPIVIDGRNVFDPKQMEKMGFYYDSIGRPKITTII
ncbi:UDP-glucose dehydrogenase family protein [Bacillus kexueae]|uniref:UDP-glucose dehydrogenase family protein n=1 Tax=Aeribacillus kexueae TaxID=2078952 RepID=UPI001FAF4646|nr:UDP-glucose/GDP-mannose dehydrogenase family protein [Bacillus kexueae]